MSVAIDMFVERAAPGSVRGDHWRVSWFDRALSKFVGGAGPNAWSALAWALVNRIETARDMIVIARNADETPARRLAALLDGGGSIPPENTEPVEYPRYQITMAVEPKRTAAARRSQTRKKAKKT